MKLAIRILAVVVVLTGAAAIAVPSSSHALPSNQIVSRALPMPGCGPGVPLCVPKPASATTLR
jgi:hypothetical protein